MARDVDVNEAAVVEQTLVQQEAWDAGFRAGLRAGTNAERAASGFRRGGPFQKPGRSLREIPGRSL